MVGTLVGAFNAASTDLPVTINGVPFAGFALTGNPTTVGDFTINETLPVGLTASDSAFASAVAPFSGLSAPYQTLLGSHIQTNFTETYQIIAAGLTPGQPYAFQVWGNKSNTGDDPSAGMPFFPDQSITVTGGSSSVQLEVNVNDLAGGTGQYAIGSFVADGTSQLFTVAATGSDAAEIGLLPFVNAFQLRVVPEPSSLAALGAGGLLVLRRRRRVP